MKWQRPPAAAAASFEVQVHPAGSAGRVRYFRLTRRHVILWSLLGLAYLLLLAGALGLVPGAIAGWVGSEEYRGLTAERAREGERLLALVGRLEQLRGRSEELLLRVRMASAAYDLPPAAEGPAADEATHGTAAESIYDSAVRQGERSRARIRSQLDAVGSGLAAVGAFETGHPDQVRATPAACPLRGDRYVLSAPFGRQRGTFSPGLGFHAGIDLAAPRGTPVLAPADGVVTFAGQVPLSRSPAWWRYGNLVAVAHGDRYLTLYGHCGDLKVTAGQQVRRGDPLAAVGSSGWSVSPHLHYEIRRRTPAGTLSPVNPLIYILDHRWPDEDRLLARDPGTTYEPLPPGLDHPPAAGRRPTGTAHPRR
jgi:murein DD-endopeptidase MepM/ murein hydrolase activator NlpD